ncbi:unnamed protein product, partial [Brassica rapa subsp. trilocularis]
APAARLLTLSRSFGSQRHVSLAKSVRTALNYNYHRVAGRILCRRLKYATGYCKWQIYKKIPSEVRDFYLVKFTLNLIFQIGR